jgi:hypothetical protein
MPVLQSQVKRVAAIQIQTWNFTNDALGTRHIGSMTQTFRAACGELGGRVESGPAGSRTIR